MNPLRQFFIYGVGGAASRLAAIFLVPLYTRTLSVADFGRLELALAAHAFVVILAGLQVESAVARDIHEAKTRGQRPALTWTALLLTAVGSLAASVLLWSLAQNKGLEDWLDGNTLALLAAMTLPAQLLGVQLAVMRFEGRAAWYSGLCVLDLLLTAAFSVWFIILLRWSIPGALGAILAAKSICVAFAWPLTLSAGTAGPVWRLPSRAWAHRLLSYGIPALPAVLVSWMQNAGSRVFTAAALTMSDVAIAGLALKVSAIFGFIIYSLRLAWEPHSIARLEQHASDPSYYRRALEWYVLAAFPLLGIALLLVPWAVGVLAPAAYGPAVAVTIFAVVAQYWTGVTNMAVVGIQGARQMGRMFPVYASGAVVSVVTLFALAPVFGAAGATIGVLAGVVISSVMAAHFSNQLFDTGFSMTLLVAAIVASVALCLALVALLAWVGHPAASEQPRNGLAWMGGGLGVVGTLTVALATGGVGRVRTRQMLGEATAWIRSRRERP